MTDYKLWRTNQRGDSSGNAANAAGNKIILYNGEYITGVFTNLDATDPIFTANGKIRLMETSMLQKPHNPHF